MTDLGERKVPAIGWLFPCGVAIAFLGAMTGVGGGLFAVPLLHVVWRFPLKDAVATSLVHVGMNCLLATATELAHPDGALRLGLVVALVAGTLVGNQLGFAAVRRIDVRRLKQAFVAVLVLVGLRLLFTAPGEGLVDALDARGGGVGDIALAVLFGAGGGFVAPLLGVGGGLVMVPGLLLTLPALGFNAIRAASMATSLVSAARSTWLHHGDKRVHWREGLWLGAGAAVGSIGGVLVAHGEDFETTGRRMLAAILWLVAARFALELWRERRGAPRGA